MSEPGSRDGDNVDTLVVHDKIGKGSYGVVYRGVLRPALRERAVEIAVAAKVMPLEDTDAKIVLREVTLQHEAGSHPSIVAMVGCFQHEGSAWLILELCSTSLHQVLRHRGALTEPQIAAVCAGALRGLDWLHGSCRIVHRDIKSANLLLSLTGETKIADFGVACRREDPALALPHWPAPVLDSNLNPNLNPKPQPKPKPRPLTGARTAARTARASSRRAMRASRRRRRMPGRSSARRCGWRPR